jgi:hypothetical protein
MSYTFLILLILTLGLAPYNPPHIAEKLGMLLKGTLKKPIDIFDLVLHSIPFVLLAYKLVKDFLFKQG